MGAATCSMLCRPRPGPEQSQSLPDLPSASLSASRSLRATCSGVYFLCADTQIPLALRRWWNYQIRWTKFWRSPQPDSQE